MNYNYAATCLGNTTGISGLCVRTGVTSSSSIPGAITGAAECVPCLSAPSSMFTVIGQTSEKQENVSLTKNQSDIKYHCGFVLLSLRFALVKKKLVCVHEGPAAL